MSIPILFGAIKATLKTDPRQRSLLREHLTHRPSELRAAINDLLDRAKEGILRRLGRRGLAIIVDNLDRITNQKVPGKERTFAEQIFIDSWSLLSCLHCHLVYTMPPSVANTPRGGFLRPLRIPMIPVAGRRGSGTGLARLTEILDRRARYAGLDPDAVFATPELRGHLASMSGGFERQLLDLLRSALSAQGDLPIERPAVDYAVRRARDDLAQGLLTQGKRWPRLREIESARPCELDSADLDLLDTHYILEYWDDDGYWYDVNPVLKLARQFRA